MVCKTMPDLAMNFDPLEVACNGFAVYLGQSAMSGSFSFSGRRSRQAMAAAASNAAWQAGLDFGISKFIPPTFPKELAQGLAQGGLMQIGEMILPGANVGMMTNLMDGVIASYGGALLVTQKKAMR